MSLLLVRYGEIGLKSASVRKRFEQALVKDISRRHALAKTPCVISGTRGRLFVESDDWRASCEALSRTFGVVSFSPVTKTSSDLESLREAALEFADGLLSKESSFAVRTRRTGTHRYSSQELARLLGADILGRFGDRSVRVDLDDPDVELQVEVREKEAYLYSSVLPGPGGMPLGTQGAVLSLVDSKSGVASSWLMMKRGCKVVVATHDTSLVSSLDPWDPGLDVVPLAGEMFSAAHENRCQGIVLPWSLADIERHGAPNGDLPVFYPLVGMSPEEVSKLLERVCV